MTWCWLDLIDEPAEERLLLRAPPAAVEVQDERIAAGELGQATQVAGVVGKLELREPAARLQIGAHGDTMPARTR